MHSCLDLGESADTTLPGLSMSLTHLNHMLYAYRFIIKAEPETSRISSVSSKATGQPVPSNARLPAAPSDRLVYKALHKWDSLLNSLMRT